MTTSDELLPPEDQRRDEIRRWIAANPAPSVADLAAAGLVCPHWPEPYGLDADPVHQLIIDEELAAAGIRRPVNTIGTGIAGPTILHAGTADQIDEYIPKILTAEEIWCQLFSEPDAGSDLASLRTRAVRDGDVYVVNGSKIWTSLGHRAKYGVLLARTDPTAPKHTGITYLVCPMDAPGITMTPLVEITGEHSFNEVFFDNVRIPVANRIGDENAGWTLAKVTLTNERVALSRAGALWGRGPTADNLIDIVADAGGAPTPMLQQRTADLKIESELMRLLRLRVLGAKLRGVQPGPEASITKALGDDHGQRVMELAKDLTGPDGMLTDVGPMGTAVRKWHYGYLYARALTIGGGTAEVQRNIIGERTLGLPPEPSP